VPGVDIGKSEAHPVEVKPKDASEWKRGPGMYGAPEFVAKEAPAWDFGVAPGRPKTVLDEPGSPPPRQALLPSHTLLANPLWPSLPCALKGEAARTGAAWYPKLT
jgi:hypothetical protein